MSKFIETYLPIFSGFYGTIWDNDSIISDEGYHHGLNSDILFAHVDWEEYFETVAEEIYERITEHLRAKGLISDSRFQKLVSPRTYNFSNDSINVEVVPNRHRLKQIVNDNWDAWHSYIKRRYSSRSGFMSYYSSDATSDEWDVDKALDDPHKLGTVIEFSLHAVFDDTPTEFDLYYDVESTHWVPYTERFYKIVNALDELETFSPDTVIDDVCEELPELKSSLEKLTGYSDFDYVLIDHEGTTLQELISQYR